MATIRIDDTKPFPNLNKTRFAKSRKKASNASASCSMTIWTLFCGIRTKFLHHLGMQISTCTTPSRVAVFTWAHYRLQGDSASQAASLPSTSGQQRSSAFGKPTSSAWTVHAAGPPLSAALQVHRFQEARKQHRIVPNAKKKRALRTAISASISGFYRPDFPKMSKLSRKISSANGHLPKQNTRRRLPKAKQQTRNPEPNFTAMGNTATQKQ